MKLHISFLSIVLAATSFSALRAQQTAQRLTLAVALDLGEKQNLDLVAARAQQNVARAGLIIAGERPNPSGSFGATRDAPHENALIDAPIEIGPRRSRRIGVARAEIGVTMVDISAVEKQVRREIRDAYFGLAHARAATMQQADALGLAQRLQGIAKARFNAGDIPELEVTQADLETARAQANLQVAQQEEKVALSDLNALLNETAETNWDLGDALVALPAPMELAELQSRAASSNTELARIVQEQKVARSQTALLQAERIPLLGLQFGADLNNPGVGPNSGGYMVGPRGQISMEIPIFSHNQGEIAQSTATQRALENQLAAARRAVDARVASAYLDLQARQTQAQLYRDTIVPSSQKFEGMAEESYRAGKANILVVLTSQHDVQQAQRDYLDSLLAVQSAFAQLEQAVGAPLD